LRLQMEGTEPSGGSDGQRAYECHEAEPDFLQPSFHVY